MEDYEWNSEHSQQTYTERENNQFKSWDHEDENQYEYTQEEKDGNFNALNL